ncbi:MAG: hypothetical protein M0P74_00860 [Syntrophales bacterium]|jgi:hypothetical protein|nr:hypothetical protein [Syntrophales bacterium]
MIQSILALLGNAKATAIAAAVILLLGLAAGGGAVWKIQNWRMANLRSQISTLESQRDACQAANKENLATIERVRKEVASVGSSWAARVKAKDTLIAKLRRIDEIPPYSVTPSGPDLPDTSGTVIEGQRNAIATLSRINRALCARLQALGETCDDETNEAFHETTIYRGPDPLLDFFNGMFPAPGGADRIHPSPGAGASGGTAILAGRMDQGGNGPALC